MSKKKKGKKNRPFFQREEEAKGRRITQDLTSGSSCCIPTLLRIRPSSRCSTRGACARPRAGSLVGSFFSAPMLELRREKREKKRGERDGKKGTRKS